MKALILSDLHLEHGHPFVVEKVDGVDILILAGDIGNFRSHYAFIKDCTTKYTVLYVLGNHEFYGYTLKEVRDFWNSVELDNFYFLDNKSVVIDDVQFIGSTLWTDFDRENPIVMLNAKRSINDFAKIVNAHNDGNISAAEILAEFKFSADFIQSELDKDNGLKKVVITHHAPSHQSVADKYIGSPINPLFASNLDNMIGYSNAVAWIHGHMHNASDYEIGDTRVIANPRGYGGENQDGFNPHFILDI